MFLSTSTKGVYDDAQSRTLSLHPRGLIPDLFSSGGGYRKSSRGYEKKERKKKLILAIIFMLENKRFFSGTIIVLLREGHARRLPEIIAVHTRADHFRARRPVKITTVRKHIVAPKRLRRVRRTVARLCAVRNATGYYYHFSRFAVASPRHLARHT